MSDEKKKAPTTTEEPKAKPGVSGELTDDALDGVAGGLGVAVPSFTGATALPSLETSTCISQT